MNKFKAAFSLTLLIHLAPNAIILHGSTRRPPLHDAIICENLKAIRAEIQKTLDINEKINQPGSCFNNMTALHIAVIMNMVNVAELLLKKGAADVINVKIHNQESLFDGWAPLHIAAYNKSEKMCNLLVGHGASTSSVISGQFHEGKRPLDLYHLKEKQ